MKVIKAGVLEIAYFETGPADGQPVILLHGFPYDAHAFETVAMQLAENGLRCFVPFLRGYGATRFLSPETMRSGQQAALGPERVKGLVICGQGYNIQNIANAWKPAPPEEETRYWYMYYFNTERGRAGLTENRHALCRHIWSLWSPSWGFDDATYAATATSFDNPDFVEIVLHSYRHRFGGVDPPVPDDFDRPHFKGSYAREIVQGAGHNLPQEAPDVFSSAILSLTATA